MFGYIKLPSLSLNKLFIIEPTVVDIDDNYLTPDSLFYYVSPDSTFYYAFPE